MDDIKRRVTPNINSKGIFEVRKPFRLGIKKIYEVIAIREFPDLHAEHIDVFETYYEPEGLTREDYERDVGLGAAIISLKGEEGVFYIPDTYIISFPRLGLANYQHVVLSVSLGPIEGKHNLSGLQEAIKETVSLYMGITPDVKIHIAPIRDNLSQKEAETIERIRKGMKDVPVSDSLKLKETTNLNNKLKASINERLKKLFKKV